MNKKILILTGGPVRKLDPFKQPAEELGLDVTLASFNKLETTLRSDLEGPGSNIEGRTFLAKQGESLMKFMIEGRDLSEFDLIYIRMVGKRLEDATMVVNYAVKHNIRLVDEVYETSLFIPSTISKMMEMSRLIEGGINVPKIYFGSLEMIKANATAELGYPYVLKSTSGRKARDVWKISEVSDFDELTDLWERERTGTRFFAQKMVKASQRVRVLVIGGKAVGAITRPTKWRRQFLNPNIPDHPDLPDSQGKKEALIPVPVKYSALANKVARTAQLDICGVDILEEDVSGVLFVIEANAAPAWNLIKKDCGVEVEKEILEYLAEKAK